MMNSDKLYGIITISFSKVRRKRRIKESTAGMHILVLAHQNLRSLNLEVKTEWQGMALQIQEKSTFIQRKALHITFATSSSSQIQERKVKVFL